MLDCLYVRFIYLRGGFSQFILIEKVRGTESKGPDNGCGADVFRFIGGLKLVQPASKKCFDVLSRDCTASGVELQVNAQQGLPGGWLACQIGGSNSCCLRLFD